MSVKGRGVFIALSSSRPRERGDPYAVSVIGEHGVSCLWSWCRRRPKFKSVVMGPRVRGDDGGGAIHHGIAKRSVLPPLDMSTAAKPVEARPRAPQSLWSL